MLEPRARITLRRIFHPTDFSEASHLAFAHALKLAIAAKGGLTILHTGTGRADDPRTEFPHVRRTLERWGLLPCDSPGEALVRLGLEVDKVALQHPDTLKSIVEYLQGEPHGLIVLATHQRDGLDRWMHQAVAVPLLRASAEMTLFVPEGAAGFVSAADGACRLNRVLIAVDRFPNPQIAVDAAVAVAEAMECRSASATVLHVGDGMPALSLPSTTSLQWRQVSTLGRPETEILRIAEEQQADLIVMSTAGRQGFLDALRGSTTERIVHNAKCPVLAAPTYRASEPIPATVEDLSKAQLSAGFDF